MMAVSALQRLPNRCCSTTPHIGFQNAVRTHTYPRRTTRRGLGIRAATPQSVGNASRGVSEIVKVLNTEVRSCKSVQELEAHYNVNSPAYDAVCVATMWMTLVNLPGSREARTAFARRPLLGKTLAVVHLMQLRALANVLWAVGRAGIDLAAESVGPHLAEAFEERIRELVKKGGIKDGREAAQLWYGLVFSKYSWSQALLQVLVEHSISTYRTWELQAQGQVALYMSQLYPHVNDEQRRQLTRALEEAVASWSLDEQQPYRSAPLITQSVHDLKLSTSPSCIKSLNDAMVVTPLNIQKEIGFKGLAHSLIRLVAMQCPITQSEASRWEDMLLTSWKAAVPKRADDFRLLINALIKLPELIPSEELKEELLHVAAHPLADMDTLTAGRVRHAAEVWGVALPLAAIRQLEQQPARGGKRQGPGGRGRGGQR